MIFSEETMEKVITAGTKNGIQDDTGENFGMKQAGSTIKRSSNGKVVQLLPEVPMEEPTFCCCGCNMQTMSILFAISYAIKMVSNVVSLITGAYQETVKQIFLNMAVINFKNDETLSKSYDDYINEATTSYQANLPSAIGFLITLNTLFLVIIILHVMIIVSPKPTVCRIIAVIYAVFQWIWYVFAGLLYLIMIIGFAGLEGAKGMVIAMVVGVFICGIPALIGYSYQYIAGKHYEYEEYLKEQAEIKKQEENQIFKNNTLN